MIERLEDAQRARQRGAPESALRWLRGRMDAEPTPAEVGELTDLLLTHKRDLALLDSLMGGLGWARERYRGLDHLADEPALHTRQGAEAELDRTVQHPLLPSLHTLEVADDALASGDLERAQRCLSRLESDAHPAERFFVRGKHALASHDAEGAAVDFAASSRFRSQLGRVYLWQGRAFAKLGQGRRAAECFDMVLALPVRQWYEQIEEVWPREQLVFQSRCGHDVFFSDGRFVARPLESSRARIYLDDLPLGALAALIFREIGRRFRMGWRRGFRADPRREPQLDLRTLLAHLTALEKV